jgi:hypothetical protein
MLIYSVFAQGGGNSCSLEQLWKAVARTASAAIAAAPDVNSLFFMCFEKVCGFLLVSRITKVIKKVDKTSGCSG